jgi:diaminopropionate ammonia-lyase
LLGVVAREQGLGVNLVTCSEGNWEQAVARMARYMGIPIIVYVPLAYVRDDEGDDQERGGRLRRPRRRRRRVKVHLMLVMDISWKGYETVPQVRLLFSPHLLTRRRSLSVSPLTPLVSTR